MSSPNPLKSYTLFSGVFLFDDVSEAGLQANFTSWLDRLKDKNEFQDRFKRTYYENYASNILESTPGGGVRHLTLNEFGAGKKLSIKQNSESIDLALPYFDLFLFEDNVGIFSFKVDFEAAEGITFERISALLNHIRNTRSPLSYGGTEVSVQDFIRQFLKPAITLADNWAAYIPQLKTYTVVEESSMPAFTGELDERIFELSHIMPVGSYKSGVYAPSSEYIEFVRTQNTVSVYANWKAIALFDTFTRISCSLPDTYGTLELEYYLIYIHCLYTKFKLYRFNSQLTNVVEATSKTFELRKKFVEFVNDYNLAYISYKFLPNLMYERISQSLEIQKELDRMERKITRLNEAHQEKKSKQLNTILLVLSLLSIVSVVTDLSQWLGLTGIPSTIIYSPWVGSSLWLIIALVAVWIFRRNSRSD